MPLPRTDQGSETTQRGVVLSLCDRTARMVNVNGGYVEQAGLFSFGGFVRRHGCGLKENRRMNPRTEVRNARCCGVCSGRMWTIRRGVNGCMAGCWHCPCCGGHFRRGEGCPCWSCRICGEKALAGRACGNCGSPCPVRPLRRKTHG